MPLSILYYLSILLLTLMREDSPLLFIITRAKHDIYSREIDSIRRYVKH